jgi:antibiotic biosynthesis monooxygenase (ABM) superfamily enzyme
MTTTSTPVVPSVHIRALLTWLTIFPLVALGMTVMAPVSADWHPVLRALVLTGVIVPLAVYLIVPRLLRLYVRAATRTVGE